jgi:HK97 family phage major capsid protein
MSEKKTAVPPPAESKPFLPVEMERGDSAPVLYRNTTVEPEDFTDENTFQIAISSEYPGVQRASAAHENLGIAKAGELFTEVLSHDPADVDLSWLNSGRAALLDEHKSNRHLGKINKANLGQDKVVRGIVEFDCETKLSKTRRNQMRKKSRVNISCGYVQTRYLGPTTLADGTVAHRFALQPREASSVADPLDPTVGLERAAEQCACYGCGKKMARTDMKAGDDGALYCGQDCIDAEDADESLRSNTLPGAGLKFRSKEEADKHFRAAKAGDFKFQRDAADEISFSELVTLVSAAADSDKRFKSKRENGDVFSAFYVFDIIFDQDEESWKATLYNWFDGTYWEVEFELDADAVTLGAASEVVPVTKYEPVERNAAAPAVDSPKLSRAAQTANHNLTKTIMAKTVAELKTEAPELVAQLESDTRTATEKTTRAAVKVEFEGEQSARAVKITERNKEIHTRADEAIKTYGGRVNGKPGAVYFCGERIRKMEAELCAKDSTFDGVELRREFGQQLAQITEGSREAKNPLEAAHLPSELAGRCSLGNLLRTAMKNREKWAGSGPYRVTEGAEFEADEEIRNNAREFPGGEEGLHPGIQLPVNMPTAIRSGTPVHYGKRDTLAGDFATAGAFIQPDYRFPFIELLRNIPVLGRAGMTMLTGLQGGRLVLPRQEAATTAQWVAEGAQLSQYDQALGQVNLNPHRIGSSQNYSRLALLQAAQIEEMIWADHMAQIALGIDSGLLSGTGGANMPLGILNTIGIGSVTFGGSAANAFKNAVAMETAVRKFNIFEEGVYLTSSTGRGMLKSVAKLLVGATTVAALPVWDDGEEVSGRSAFDSQQIPGDILLYLVGRHVIFAQWGGLAVVLDTLTRADRDEFKLSLNTYADGALRHAQAVCRTSDSIAVLS